MNKNINIETFTSVFPEYHRKFTGLELNNDNFFVTYEKKLFIFNLPR